MESDASYVSESSEEMSSDTVLVAQTEADDNLLDFLHERNWEELVEPLMAADIYTVADFASIEFDTLKDFLEDECFHPRDEVTIHHMREEAIEYLTERYLQWESTQDKLRDHMYK